MESDDQVQAFAARITLLARERDVLVHELAGRAAAAARPRVREEAILAFQQHVAAEHGDMVAWASHLMRELLRIVQARVEVWPQRDVQSGTASDRAVLHVTLPLAGERRAALSRLLREEHVLTAVEGASGSSHPGGLGTAATLGNVDCADHSFARSTMYT